VHTVSSDLSMATNTADLSVVKSALRMATRSCHMLCVTTFTSISPFITNDTVYIILKMSNNSVNVSSIL